MQSNQRQSKNSFANRVDVDQFEHVANAFTALSFTWTVWALIFYGYGDAWHSSRIFSPFVDSEVNADLFVGKAMVRFVV